MNEEQWQQLKASSPVRIQWNPERDLKLSPLDHRAIQIGLSHEAVQLYVNEWITSITDVTPLAHQIHALIEENKLDEATQLLPLETIYIP